MTTSTSGAGRADRAPAPGLRLPAPSLRRQPALLRRIFDDPQPVLDELSAELRPDLRVGRRPGAHGHRRRPARAARAVRHAHRPLPVGPQVQRARLRRRTGVDDRVRRRRPQAPPHARCRPRSAAAGSTAGSRRSSSGPTPPSTQLLADLGPERRTSRPLSGRPGARARDRRAVAVRRAPGQHEPARSASCSERPQDYLESPAVKQLPHPFPGTDAGSGPGRPAGPRRHHRRRDRRTCAATRPTTRSTCWQRSSRDGALHDAEIRDQVATLIGAGYDTTSASLVVDVLVRVAHARASGSGCGPRPTTCFGADRRLAEPRRAHAGSPRARRRGRCARRCACTPPA